jgi:hypothetical protein
MIVIRYYLEKIYLKVKNCLFPPKKNKDEFIY